MLRLISTISLRELRQTPLRALLMFSGIAAGVTLLTAVNIVNGSITEHLKRSARMLAGRAALQVIAPGAEQRVAVRLVPALASVDGVETASAVLDTIVPLADRPESQRIFAADFSDERLAAAYGIRLDDGANPATLLIRPGAAVATRDATAAPAPSASSARLAGAAGTVTLEIVGRLAEGSPLAAAARDLLVLDMVEAQTALGLGDVADRIDIMLAPDARIESVRDGLYEALGPGFEVVTPAERGLEFARTIGSFQSTLRAFGLLALVAGVFVVYSATSTAVRARTRGLGILRAVGVTPCQIVALLVGEVILVSLVASVTGAIAGLALSFGLSELVRETMSTIYFYPFTGDNPALDATAFGIAVMAGTTAAIAGAVVPSRRTLRMDPISAISQEQLEAQRDTGSSRRLLLLALVLGLAAAASIPLEIRWKSAALGNIVSITWFIAFVLFSVPAVAWLATRVSPLLERWLGVTGLIAAQNISASARRSAVAVAALALAVAAQITFAGLGHSFEKSIDAFIADFMNADLVVSSNHTKGGWLEDPIDAYEMARLADVEGVRRIDAFRLLPGQRLGEHRISVLAATRSFLDPETFGRWFVEGEPVDALARVRDARAVLISQTLAHFTELDAGDVLELPTPSGALRLPIAGIIVDYTSDRGSVILDSATFALHWNDLRVSRILLHAEPGVPSVDLHNRVAAMLGPRDDLRIQSHQEVVARQRREFEESFKATRILELFLIIVTITGIIDAVVSSVSERRRELALMRATGATPLQLERTIMIEAWVMILAGLTLGIVGGSLSAWMWVNFHATYFLGWIIDFHFPWVTAARACGLAALAAAAAAYVPARFAAREDVLSAMRYE
jgi:putative ABC transport system permease protein